MAWLYRYVIRGIGVVLLLGMITILILAIRSQTKQPVDRPAHNSAATQP